MNQRVWTLDEVTELRKMWNKYPLYKLATHFHAAVETIEEKAKELGLEDYKSNRWSKEEEKLLREYSKKYVTKTIAKKLGRSYLSVQKKAIKLGIELHSERDPWKKWMIEYLKENINNMPIGEISSVLNISYRRILTKCKELGIEYKKEGWTEEEINILRTYASTCHYTELTKVLPNRSVGAITAKAYELGIETISQYTKLDDSSIKFLKENWGKIPATEIARQLKTSIGVINRYKRNLNLPNIGQQQKWTEEIIEKIRKDAQIKTRTELAKKYRTSPEQISRIASQNNITLINSRNIWTEDLDKILLDLINKGLNTTEIAANMVISATLVRKRMKQLGVSNYLPTIKNYRKWSQEEVQILIDSSQTKTIYELAKLLNKTERQVYSKAKKLGISLLCDTNEWTDSDTEKLMQLALEYEVHAIAQLMSRSENIIRTKAKEFGITIKNRPRKNWANTEVEQLKELAQRCTIKEIAKILDRSVASISGKLRDLGIQAQESSKFWTEEEKNLLIQLNEDHDISEIAKIMNKSDSAIIAKLYALGLKTKSREIRIWSEEESRLLLELLSAYSTFEVAEILNRSEEAIRVRAQKLGYEINSKHRRWTREEEIQLTDLWGIKSIEIISKMLNRTASAIINRVYILGLGSQISNNYDGLKIQDIADMFAVNRNTVLTSWVALGLKLDFRKRSNSSIYAFVSIDNLYEFLEQNQNIWDSRLLEKNILGKEPEWLLKKRERDYALGISQIIGIENLTKQQLLNSKSYFLELKEMPNQEESAPVKTKKQSSSER